MLKKLTVYAYDGGFTIRREFDTIPSGHDWVYLPGEYPTTLGGWINLAVALREVTKAEVEEADSITLEVTPWSEKDGVTFRWKSTGEGE